MSILATLASSLLGGLFGGGSRQQVAAPTPVQAVQMPSAEEDDRTIALWEGWQSQMAAQKPQTTGFDPVAALMRAQGQRPAGGMQQSANSRGGQSFPRSPGQGLFAEPLGEGRGGGGTAATNSSSTTQQQWHDMLTKLTSGAQAQQYTAPLQSGFTQYMQQALGGQAGLPQEAYQAALLRGQGTINAQAQQSREGLTEQLGARGLLQSGLTSRGLRGVEEAKMGSIGDLISGLAQQDMQARVEAQRAAAGMLPSLISAQTGAQSNTVQSWLEQERLDLERGRLGLAEKQQSQSANDSFWGALGSIAGSLFGGGGSAASTSSPASGGWLQPMTGLFR